MYKLNKCISSAYLCLFLVICSSSSEECYLPEKQSYIDTAELQATWYLTITSRGPHEITQGLECTKMINFQPNGDFVHIDEQMVNTENIVSNYTETWQRMEDGSYVLQTFDDNIIEDSAGDHRKQLVEDLNDQIHGRMFVETDYKSYIIQMICGRETDKKYIYIYTKRKNPSARNVITIWRRLAELGQANIPIHGPICRARGF